LPFFNTPFSLFRTPFTIPLWGGWGDMLREVSLLPVAKLPWLRFQTRYGNIHPEDFHPEATLPTEEAVKDLFSRCPHLGSCEKGKISRMEKIVPRGLRKFIEIWDTGLFDPQWTWKEEDKPFLDPEKFHIAVQTHLAGLPSKKWPPEHWKNVCKGLLQRFPKGQIHIIDPQGEIFEGDGIIVHSHLTFPQAVCLIESCHFLISVDSWSKYVAGWKNLPQIVIVPDQTSDYPHLTAEVVWRHSFRGLHPSRKNKQASRCKIVGMEASSPKGKITYTFGSMAHLQVSDILHAIDTFHFPVDGTTKGNRS